MAGDWIKLERATPNKPEILEAAEFLGIKRREAIGLFVEYFVWLDENLSDSTTGLVTHVTRQAVDTLMTCPGFSAMLEQIGWAKFNDEAKTLRVINASRHVGTSAKTRALTRERVTRHRNAKSVTGSNACNALEKRREDIKREVDVNTQRLEARSTPAEISALAIKTEPQSAIKEEPSDRPTAEQLEAREAERRRQLELVKAKTA